MNKLSLIAGALLALGALAAPTLTAAPEKTAEKDAVKKPVKAKPYALKTCLVSDEKFGGDMGEPYIFTYKDREIKLCCKDCKKDFEKDPAKFVKKLEVAEKKAAESKPDKK